MPRRRKNIDRKKKDVQNTNTRNGSKSASTDAPREPLQGSGLKEVQERKVNQKMKTSLSTPDYLVPFTVPHPEGGFYIVHHPIPASSFFTKGEGFVDDEDTSLDQDEELNRLVSDIVEEDKSSKYLPPPTRVYRLWG